MGNHLVPHALLQEAINLVPCSSLQYMEVWVLFLAKKWDPTSAVPHLSYWLSDRSRCSDHK